ncbi:hypothetical protein QJS04_geneDACA005342 [Acorus gramineus]|uniref:RING-type E3 ubiquitin transferase n=1 Tax=Acorus gramineus TaxID=55184 RepID=A0AAV9B1V1_ACOGR|nr:hypothetical protein QJS04_geneDACA005342 [Acorus gramineus]
MAGMLPGVECARRRRFHQGGSADPLAGVGICRTRRSSFCLYTSNYDTIHVTSNTQRNTLSQSLHDGQLEDVAREAKERLDERIKKKRYNNTGSLIRPKKEEGGQGKRIILANVDRDIFVAKKGSSKRFAWTKLNWKASEQRECAICLEEFREGEVLANLPCAHRFHWRCMVPWLDRNAHCPCCRMDTSLFKN